MPEPELPSLFATTPRRWAVAGKLGEKPKTSVSGEVPVTEGLALFEQPETGAESGYERWKSEAAEARAKAETARRAEELPALGDDAGYAAWKREVEEAKRSFERRWGVPPGCVVRVQLRGEPMEREGVLRVSEAPAGPKAVLRLQVGDRVFEVREIEHLVTL